LSGYDNIKVESFGGLLVDFAKEKDAKFIVRGLRAVTDFEYELQISQMNRTIYSEIDTLFLTTSLEYAYLSSSIVKEVASYGGDISHFVPESIIPLILERVRR
jgi:pantetheine-phosphate adenylyltransferase